MINYKKSYLKKQTYGPKKSENFYYVTMGRWAGGLLLQTNMAAEQQRFSELLAAVTLAFVDTSA